MINYLDIYCIETKGIVSSCINGLVQDCSICIANTGDTFQIAKMTFMQTRLTLNIPVFNSLLSVILGELLNNMELEWR